MKNKFLILAVAILAIGTVALTGCNSDNSAASSTDTSAASSEAEVVSSDVSDVSSIIDEVTSTTNNMEGRGEVVNGIFTSTNGIYKVTVPEGVNLLTATDTTTVFSANEGKTSITISYEANNSPFQNLSEETFSNVYKQLYGEYAVTNFESKAVSDKQTDYKLSFTGKDKEKPLQIHVFKAMTNQRAVTIQVSAAQDNEHATTILDTMAATLIFDK